MDISKHRQYLLSEIKVNNPTIKLELTPRNYSDHDISEKSLNQIGLKLRQGSYPGVNLFKNYLYYSPSYQNEGDIPEISRIFSKNGIQNTIVTWYGHPYIKIKSNYYKINKK